MKTRLFMAPAMIWATTIAFSWTAVAQAATASGESAADIRKRARQLYIANSSDPAIGPLFQKAADMGDALASMWLAIACSDGTCGLKLDTDRAAKLVKSAMAEAKRQAESGNPEAQFLWATALSTGIGIGANAKEAFAWFLKAAQGGDDISMNNVAIAYLNGVGTAANDAEAFKWLSAGAKTGNCFAMYNLGRALLKGRGTPRDEAGAVSWNLKAAEKGFLPAMIDMALMYQWGTGVESDLDKAREWYAKAAQKGASVDAALAMLEPSTGGHKVKADGIRTVPYVKAFGLSLSDYTKAAIQAGIASPNTAPKGPLHAEGMDVYAYADEGMCAMERGNGIWAVELFDGGQKGFGRFKGKLPLELTWDDTVQTVRAKLGRPDNEGWASADETVYAMAYAADNMNLVATFSANRVSPDNSTLRTLRIMAKWPPQAKGVRSKPAR